MGNDTQDEENSWENIHAGMTCLGMVALTLLILAVILLVVLRYTIDDPVYGW